MRQISANALHAILAQETAEVLLACIRIEHPDIPTLRLVANGEAVQREDGEYLPYPFKLVLPTQLEDQIPTLKLSVDNIDLSVSEVLRQVSGQPKIVCDVVLASSPDTIEMGPYVANVADAKIDAQTIEFTLTYEQDIFDQSVPAQLYTPANSRGLYA